MEHKQTFDIRRTVLWALVAAVVAFGIYANNLGHDWAYDDFEYITENEYVREPGHTGDILTTTYLYGVREFRTALYRPLTVLSYAANRMVTGLEPGAFHLVNNLLHAANSALVYVLLTVVPGTGGLALPAALLFATHPLHTEAVTNIVGRAELLAFLFSVSALILYALRERNRKLFLPLSALLFFAALLSKETPAALPFALLLLAAGRYHHGAGGKESLKSEFAGITGWFAMLGLYIVLRSVVIARCGPVPDVMMHDNPLAGMGFFERLPAVLTVTAKYALLLVFPLRLSADYSYNQIPVDVPLTGLYPIAGFAVAAALAIMLVRSMRGEPDLLYGVVLLILPWLVVSNLFFPTGTIMGERLMYLSSLGFVIVAAWGIRRVSARLPRPERGALAIALAVSILFGIRTVARNPDWRDNTAIFTSTAISSPNSVKAAYNYALVLKKAGRPDDAILWYRKAVDIWPGHFSAWFNLGNTLRETGRPNEAVEAYRRASELVPEDSGTLMNLALTLRSMNRHQEAVETFERILEIRPGDRTAMMNIGTTWAGAGELDKAKKVFETMLVSQPDDADALVNLGNVAVIAGDTLRAEAMFGKALASAPDDPAANNALLGLLIARGQYEQAKQKAAEMSARRIPVRKRYIETIEQYNHNERSRR